MAGGAGVRLRVFGGQRGVKSAVGGNGSEMYKSKRSKEEKAGGSLVVCLKQDQRESAKDAKASWKHVL